VQLNFENYKATIKIAKSNKNSFIVNNVAANTDNDIFIVKIDGHVLDYDIGVNYKQ